MSVRRGCRVPWAQVGVLLAGPPHQCHPWDPELRVPLEVRPEVAGPDQHPQPGLSRQEQGKEVMPTPGPCSAPHGQGWGPAGTPTVALASAALAFFSRALQASKSRRRFWRSRLSFCGQGTGSNETLGHPGPAVQDRETEAQGRKGIHSKELSPQEPWLRRPQGC